MNKEKNKKGRKYAFNINDINSHKKIKGSLLDFKSLNRGTYDEIETNDMTIRDNSEKLKLLKNKAIKELVYTNKDIPIQWKNKLEYKPNLLKLFLNDTNFLCYLGNGGVPIRTKNPKNKERQITNLKTSEINKTKLDANKTINENKEKEKVINTLNRTLSNAKIGKFKEKHTYLDKEIIGILDDFKIAYPILIKEKENNEIYIHKNKRHNEENKIQSFNNNSNTFYKKRNINDKIILPNLKLKNNNKRQNTFRQNIFTNLLPSSSAQAKIEANKTYTNFSNIKNKTDLYLNSNNEIFEKKISINNPIIMKYLEGINFYGPYFSYCPPCGNKNLEFYKNLEQRRCLQIIQQIKKNKGKNFALSEDKKNKKIKEKKEIIKDYVDKFDNESNNYNIKGVKNNLSDSMIQQLSSKGN